MTYLQINMLLNFKEDDLNCPCPIEIQQLLQDFHNLISKHCGRWFVYL